jgi:hypothetical protein
MGHNMRDNDGLAGNVMIVSGVFGSFRQLAETLEQSKN